MHKNLIFFITLASSWLNCSTNFNWLTINPVRTFSRQTSEKLKFFGTWICKLTSSRIDFEKSSLTLYADCEKNRLIFTCKNNNQSFEEAVSYPSGTLQVSKLDLTEINISKLPGTQEYLITIPFKR